MTNLSLLAEASIPAVTWPQAFVCAVGFLCVVAFVGLLVTERWPWQRD